MNSSSQWHAEYQKFLEKQVESNQVHFYIQNVKNNEEYAVVKILDNEFFYRVVYCPDCPDKIGLLYRNTKWSIWDLNVYDISCERKFGL